MEPESGALFNGPTVTYFYYGAEWFCAASRVAQVAGGAAQQRGPESDAEAKPAGCNGSPVKMTDRRALSPANRD